MRGLNHRLIKKDNSKKLQSGLMTAIGRTQGKKQVFLSGKIT